MYFIYFWGTMQMCYHFLEWKLCLKNYSNVSSIKKLQEFNASIDFFLQKKPKVEASDSTLYSEVFVNLEQIMKKSRKKVEQKVWISSRQIGYQGTKVRRYPTYLYENNISLCNLYYFRQSCIKMEPNIWIETIKLFAIYSVKLHKECFNFCFWWQLCSHFDSLYLSKFM